MKKKIRKKLLLFILFIISILIFIFQEIYRRFIYKSIIKGFKDFDINNSSYNDYLESIYNKRSISNNNFYKKLDNKNLEIDTVQTLSIIKKSFISETPYLFDLDLSEINENEIILDCGAGNGNFSIYLAKKFKKITIINITNSINSFNNIQDNIKKNGFENKIYVQLLDFDLLNESEIYKKGKFDKIYFIESHGFSNDRKKLFKSCNFMLKINGLLYIRTPVFCNKNDDYFKDIVNYWNYNFSTSYNICNDLNNLNFKTIYSEIDCKRLFLSYNIFTIISIALVICEYKLITNYKLILSHINLILYGLKIVVIKAKKIKYTK